MNILITINKNYLFMVKDMLRSVAINNNCLLNVYLLYEELNDKDIDYLRSYMDKYNIGKLYAIYINIAIQFPLNIDYISKETYFRLFAPYYLPDDIDRILFLDADIICSGNIEELYNMNFCDNIIIGCENFDSNNHLYNERLGLDYNNTYINAGVLLINLDLYRKFISMDEILYFVNNNYNILLYQDQDVINKLFCGRIGVADYRYNYQINMVIGFLEDRVITHYTTVNKPWFYWYNKPMFAVDFYNYLRDIGDDDRLNQLVIRHNQDVLISVIIPVYNVGNYLKRCLDSVINQTIRNIEIILIDDGSSDESGEICDDYALLDNRVIVIHQDNFGLSAARNRGLEIARGKYIGFVDSDDYIDFNMYKLMYEYLEVNDLDIVVSNFYHLYSDNSLVLDKILDCNKIWNNELDIVKTVLEDYEVRNFVWSKLYKRELWNNVRFPFGKVYEDICVSIPVVLNCSKMGYFSEPLYYYNHRENSISKKYDINNIKDAINNSFDRYIYVKDKYKEIEIINLASILNRIMCEYYENRNFFKDNEFFDNFRNIIIFLLKDYSSIKSSIVDEYLYYNINLFIKEIEKQGVGL